MSSVKKQKSSHDPSSSYVQYLSIPPSKCSSALTGTYDVFLSFRGKDTRKGFLSHLYTALTDRGIHTFRDDDRLKSGKSIKKELPEAIEDSKIAIIVFSENYADSSWCLDELVQIVAEESKKIVIPVFYYVEPSDIRWQENVVAKALEKHQNIDDNRMKSWKKALTDATNFKGWHLSEDSDLDESECILRIVASVHHELNHRISSSSEDLVGMERRVNRVLEILRLGECEKVIMVGIWGIGGGGKTTVAKATLDKLSFAFDGGSCFLEIPTCECSENELKNLQKILLSKILKLKLEEIDIRDTKQGINLMKQRLKFKKILIVLDNVGDRKQLKALAPHHDLLSPGSRVIITTRDKKLLNRVDELYEVELLNDIEAMQLFSLNAFQTTEPYKEFIELSNEVVKYADCLPLAIQVLGSHLEGLRLKEEWMSEIIRLQKAPHHEILSILKISYDGLDETDKNIFLDVACFFRGWEVNEVKRILDSFESYHKRGIRNLQRKSLVSVDKMGYIEMHDLVQKMGQNIVRKDHPGSRLWEEKEIHDLLSGEGECDAAEGVVLTWNEEWEALLSGCSIVSNEALEKMKRVRLLVLRDYIFREEIEADEEECECEPDEGVVPMLVMKKMSAPLFSTSSINVCVIVSNEALSWMKKIRLLVLRNYISSPDEEFCMCSTRSSVMERGMVALSSFTEEETGNCSSSSFPGDPCSSYDQSSSILPSPSVFFDVACFFRGWEVTKVKQKLDSFESYDTRGMSFIEGKSLLSVDEEGRKEMHDLVQEIVRKGHPDSWLPQQKDFDVLMGKMDFLVRYLDSHPEHPSNELQLFRCPKPSLPISETLRLLNISESEGIRESPDFSRIPCLEELWMTHCESLVEIHSSFGDHQRLQLVDFSGCRNLRKLPERLRMRSLKRLNLQSCKKLNTFPEIEGNMTSLEELNVSFTGIKRRPHIIRNLSGRRRFDLCWSKGLGTHPHIIFKQSGIKRLQNSQPSNRVPFVTAVREVLVDGELFKRTIFTLPFSFPQLKLLNLMGCNLASLAIPESCLPSLQQLCLQFNRMKELVISEDCLFSLRLLDLRYNWPIDYSTKRCSDLSNFKLGGSFSMVSLIHTAPTEFYMRLERTFDWEALTHVLHRKDSELTLQLNGTQIPEWFKYRICGLKCEVILPPLPSCYRNSLRGLAIFLRIDFVSFLRSPETMISFPGKEFSIASNEMLFHYMPINNQWLKQCLSDSKATLEPPKQICLFDGCIASSNLLRDDICNDAVEWGVRLVYEDETYEVNYNGIIHELSDGQDEYGRDLRLKVVFSGEDTL